MRVIGNRESIFYRRQAISKYTFPAGLKATDFVDENISFWYFVNVFYFFFYHNLQL